MSAPLFESVQLGDKLPALTLPAISRTTLALFAGASGDHNPIHIDIDSAKTSGVPDVFAQGMLPMAYLGRFLTLWVPQSQLRHYAVRFSAMTPIAARLTCSGKVAEKLERNGERLVKLEINVADEQGEIKLTGEALVALH